MDHKITVNWVGNGAVGVGATITESADGEQNADVALNASEANKQVNIDFEFAKLQAFFVLSDQDVTLETNNSNTTDDVVNLKKDKPFLYCKAAGHINPFDANVTKLFLTNLTTTAATVKIRVLKDVTP